MMLLPICLFAVSCAADNQPKQPTVGTNTMSKPDPWIGARPMKPPTPAPTAAKQNARQPINASASSKKGPSLGPPKDAQFTLYCADYTGPSHVEIANRAKQDLSASSGLRSWYVIHQEDRSTLFHGYYKEMDDAGLKRDRATIEALQDQRGNRLVRSAVSVPVDAPDPIAPPEWNLANVRHGELDARHYWTLQIGAYKDDPRRKQAAIEAVRAARQSGIEAFYYHGETISSVCVGVWPEESLRIEGMKVVPGGRDMQSGGAVGAASTDPDQQFLVAPGMNIPDKMKAAAGKRGMGVAQPKVTIVDPTMLQVKERFREHAVNGLVELMTDEKGQRVPRPSLFVQIPVGGPSGSTFDPPTPPPPAEAVRQLQPETQAPASGGGRLKSIGK
ncbi:MAG: hypothetical protein H7Z14_05700 [Anaerolineae bacterium]|nr:hypothetical protein [Phycisphaerae bacterium]